MDDNGFGLLRGQSRMAAESRVEIGWTEWRVIAGLLIVANNAPLMKNLVALFHRV